VFACFSLEFFLLSYFSNALKHHISPLKRREGDEKRREADEKKRSRKEGRESPSERDGDGITIKGDVGKEVKERFLFDLSFLWR
jgi:hypothetical protein